MNPPITDTLPDTLSGLLTVALDDLAKVEADPAYEVSMVTWHEPHVGSRCYVCLAGAIMAKSLGCSNACYLLPKDFVGSLGNKLYALNSLRIGDCATALAFIDPMGCHKLPGVLLFVHVPPYRHPDFVPTLRALAASLKEAGL